MNVETVIISRRRREVTIMYPTQERLKQLFEYDKKTGVVTRKIKIHSNKSGSIVGGKPNGGYLRAKVDGKQYSLHRLIWIYVKGEEPCFIDHVNGVRVDNKWENLRSVTVSENNRNSSLSARNKSGVLGVYWINKDKRWRATIGHDNKRILLGHFKHKEDAIIARIKAEIKYGYHENHGKRTVID